MIASEICKEDVELVGVVLDKGAPGTKKPRPEAGSALTRWAMMARLALRIPSAYADRWLGALCRVFGMRRPSLYERLRRKEAGALRLLEKAVGAPYLGMVSAARRFPLLSEVARDQGVAVHAVSNVNDEDSAALLRHMAPDLVIGLGTRILRPHILAIPRLGCLNAHSSLLPEYRGGTTEFWQLAAGEAETGVTVHWMVEKVDAGGIVARGQWPICPGTNHVALRTVSQFGRLSVWRRAIRAVLDQEQAVPPGPAQTPVFRHPTLAQIYQYYVEGRSPAPRV